MKKVPNSKEIRQIAKKYKSIMKCNNCGDVIYSKHRHDYVTCSCGNISVDGGNDYCKGSFSPGAKFQIWNKKQRKWSKLHPETNAVKNAIDRYEKEVLEFLKSLFFGKKN